MRAGGGRAGMRTDAAALIRPARSGWRRATRAARGEEKSKAHQFRPFLSLTEADPPHIMTGDGPEYGLKTD